MSGEDDFGPLDEYEAEGGAAVAPLRAIQGGRGLTPDQTIPGLKMKESKDGLVVPKKQHYLTLIFQHHQEWQGLRWNEMTGAADLLEAPVLAAQKPPRCGPVDAFVENFAICWVEARYGTSFSAEAVLRAMEVAAKCRPYHPVRDWLVGLEWDRAPRVNGWLARYCAAEDTQINTVMGRKWLVSAVARAMTPGCQADNLLVLEGAQGTGKTTALRSSLLPYPEWFLPSVPDLANKDAQQALQGVWIACLDEMKALVSVRHNEAAKNYLTETIDTYRPPYGRHFVKRPRSCVFVGTTNSDEYLSDPTGNRRFWPVKVGQIAREELARDREQLWAEAVEIFRESQEECLWWLTREEQLVVDELTGLRTMQDEWANKVSGWLDGRREVQLGDVLTSALEFDNASKWSSNDQKRVAQIMQQLGWRRRRAAPRTDGSRPWVYVKQEKETEE